MLFTGRKHCFSSTRNKTLHLLLQVHKSNPLSVAGSWFLNAFFPSHPIKPSSLITPTVFFLPRGSVTCFTHIALASPHTHPARHSRICKRRASSHAFAFKLPSSDGLCAAQGSFSGSPFVLLRRFSVVAGSIPAGASLFSPSLCLSISSYI